MDEPKPPLTPPLSSSSSSSSSSARSSVEEPLLGYAATPSHTVPLPSEILRAMSSHSRDLRKSSFSYASSTPSSSAAPSRRASDVELAGSDWANSIWAKRRQTRRSTILLISVILGSGLVYMLIDNFLLADWVSARSRYTPSYLGVAKEVVDVPDHPDPQLVAGSWMGAGVIRIPEDEAHVLIPNPAHLPPSPALLGPVKRFPPSLLVPYYALGHLPLEPAPPIPYPTLDIIYTFVNASSPVLLQAKDARMEDEGLPTMRGAARHWRDNGELRGAVRSAAQSFADGLRKVHVVSADFELDSVGGREAVPDVTAEEAEEEGYEFVDRPAEKSKWRVGQVPSWLNTETRDLGVQWHFHSEIFRLPADEDGVDRRIGPNLRDEKEWRELAMPNFNSFQIESKVGWVKDLSENFILSNDDMFFMRDMSPSDFHHPLLGPVFRLAPDRGLRVSPTLGSELRSDPGEWGGLQYANALLSSRFYPKRRMYMSHVPKTMTVSLAHEASVMFAPELAEASTRGFRESKRGRADVHFGWLVTHLQIERWREALLWSWAVARLGEDGMWRERAREEMWDVLGLTGEKADLPEETFIVQAPRSTLEDMDELMSRNEWQFPEASEYLFTSLDGHVPDMPSSNPTLASCIFSLEKCLPRHFFSDSSPLPAADMFTRLAFSHPECGDCLVMALVKASGPKGLSAVLPDAEQSFEPETRDRREWDREEPMLPLVSDWIDGNFSLASVVRPGQDKWNDEPKNGTVNLRDFCVKLMSRYIYSLATSPTHFALSRSPNELRNVLYEFDHRQGISMACLNDDQPDTASGESGYILGAWMESKFGQWGAGWERPDWAWTPSGIPKVVAQAATATQAVAITSSMIPLAVSSTELALKEAVSAVPSSNAERP